MMGCVVSGIRIDLGHVVRLPARVSLTAQSLGQRARERSGGNVFIYLFMYSRSFQFVMCVCSPKPITINCNIITIAILNLYDHGDHVHVIRGAHLFC
jgi:hypothetical protein